MNSKTVARFWRKVDRDNGPILDERLGRCWIWVGSRHLRGYGEIRIAGRIHRAHRIAWELAHKPIGNALIICHACDNPSCVNPAHLWLGTNATNTADSVSKGRRAAGTKHGSRTRPDRVRKGETHGRAKLNETTVREIRESSATYRELARVYGVGETTIWHVKSRRQWRHV